MTLPHNTRSEPANRQRARSPSMDSVKKNLSASLIACDTFCPGECYSPVRRSRSPIRGARSPVHYSPVRRYRSPVRNVDASVAHKTSSMSAQQASTTPLYLRLRLWSCSWSLEPSYHICKMMSYKLAESLKDAIKWSMFADLIKTH